MYTVLTEGEDIFEFSKEIFHDFFDLLIHIIVLVNIDVFIRNGFGLSASLSHD